MTAVPRAANGDFLPPQYRLDSVPACEIRAGDRISWNEGGRAKVREVRRVVGRTVDGRLAMVLVAPGFTLGELVTVNPVATVNRVEVLW